MSNKKPGVLVVIGGAEDRTDEKVILREVARHVGRGPLVVTTVASAEPDGLSKKYHKAFRDLGVKEVRELELEARAEARREEKVRTLDGASGIFFTGGDQLRITSQIGDTPIFRRVQELHRGGGVVAGTSAGASVLCQTMLVSGASEASAEVGEAVRMAPGLGLIGGVIIDQHFAERGRMGRLVGAVAQNPASLGMGIDENTAVVVEADRWFRVVGEGAVYVIDGSAVTASNIAEEEAGHNLSVFDLTVHVLSDGDRFDLKERRPAGPEDRS